MGWDGMKGVGFGNGCGRGFGNCGRVDGWMVEWVAYFILFYRYDLI